MQSENLNETERGFLFVMAVIEKEVLRKALIDPKFAKGAFIKLPVGAFSADEAFSELFKVIKKHYRLESEPLTERALLALIETEYAKSKNKDELIERLGDVAHDLYTLDDIGSEDDEHSVIRKSINEFVRGKMMYQTLQELMTSNVELGDEDGLQRFVKKFQEIATMDTSGSDVEIIDFKADVDRKIEEYSNLQENRYPTGFQQIDDASGGGIARGEVGMIIAASGRGKSTWAVQQGSNYNRRGLNVLYITLEEKIGRMMVKIEKNLLGVSDDQLFHEDGTLNMEVFDAAQSIYKNSINMGEYFIAKFRPQEADISDIEQVILDIKYRKGIDVDAVILDYPDLMKNQHYARGASESDAGGKLVEDIRALAGKHNFICWILSQLNRTGYGADLKTAEAIEGSKRKLNAVELAFTLNQTNEEFEEGFIRIHMDKVRYTGTKDYQRIQLYTIDRNGLVIEDATEGDRNFHRDNVMSGKDSISSKNTADKANKVRSNINTINSSLGGGS